MTLEEQERRAYADGDLAKAAILAAALGVIETLQEDVAFRGYSTAYAEGYNAGFDSGFDDGIVFAG